MASIRGKITKMYLGKVGNLNPKITPNPVEKMSKLWNNANNDKKPFGYSLEKCATSKGTLYEKVYKTGEEKNGRVIYYLHGGAYISGLLSVYRKLSPQFYKAAGVETIFLDYKCAPEYKYPTQLNEAIDVWDDLMSQGYKPKDIIVGGDSAGANLALAFLLKLRDEGREMPLAGFCFSAWADMTGKGESYKNNYPHDILFGEKGRNASIEDEEELLNSEIYSFIGDADRHDPYVSPVYGEYHNFPPMYFTVGGHEMLLDDTLTVVKKLKEKGVEVGLDVQKEMFHIYPLYGMFVPEGRKSFLMTMDFIKNKFIEHEKK